MRPLSPEPRLRLLDVRGPARPSTETGEVKLGRTSRAKVAESKLWANPAIYAFLDVSDSITL
jgi:hypothetical protein